MRNIATIAAAVTLALALAGCSSSGSSSAASSTQSASASTASAEASSSEGAPASSPEAAPVEDGQNPIMNFIGPYAADRALVTIEPGADNGARVTVNWGSSATENTTWYMEGEFDTDTLTITYTDATKTTYVYKADGTVESETVEYTDGTGSFTFADGSGKLSLIWQDDKENAGEGLVFEYAV